MQTIIAASGWAEVGVATGVGVVAIVVGGFAIFHTLGGEDRGQMLTLIRHPLRTIFTEDEPDPDDF